MIDMDIINLIITFISIVATCVSIYYSCQSRKEAKNAERYRNEAFLLKESMTLEEITGRFISESNHFLESTRKSNWYKGIDVNSVITPLSNTLNAFDSIYHLLSDTDIQSKVKTLHGNIQHYYKANAVVRKETEAIIFDISTMLQQEISKGLKIIANQK